MGVITSQRQTTDNESTFRRSSTLSSAPEGVEGGKVFSAICRERSI